jgi:hypothetical protein
LFRPVRGDDIFDEKPQSFQMGVPPPNVAWQVPAKSDAGRNAGAVMIPPHTLHMRFTFFC